MRGGSDVERLAEQGSLQLGGALVDALAADHECAGARTPPARRLAESRPPSHTAPPRAVRPPPLPLSHRDRGYEELADHLRDGSASHRPDSPNRPPLSPAASGTAASKPPDAGLQRDASFGSEASRSAQESVSKSAGEATPSAAPSPVKQGLLACYRQGSMRGLQQHHSSHNVAGEAREERVARAAATGASGLLHLQLERAILNAVESSEQRIMTRLKAHHEKLGARLKRIEDDLGSILDLEQPSAVRRAQKQLQLLKRAVHRGV